jgi:putative ABC transport system ATP-binding protein
VLDLLCAQAREQGAGCLIVTHSAAAAQRADRVLYLDIDGVGDTPADATTAAGGRSD